MSAATIRTPEQVVELELELDLRLLGLVEALDVAPEVALRADLDWALMRAAYGRGYDDAVRERGVLQRVPRR